MERSSAETNAPGRLTKPGVLRLVLAGGLVFLAPIAVHAAPADAAQARAAAYQTEMREVLKKHHWRITHDEGGTLTARHALGPDAADLPGAYAQAAGYVRLTTVFKPQSATNTGTNVGLVAVYVDHTDRTGKFVFTEPAAFDNPATAKAVQDMFAEARKRLFAAHPEYAGR